MCVIPDFHQSSELNAFAECENNFYNLVLKPG